jgi:Rhamnan synthesis protein F
MAIIGRIGSEIGVVKRYTGRRLFKTFFFHGYRLIDMVRLANYETDIKKVVSYKDTKEGIFSIFVYYEPNGKISGSASRILKAMFDGGINTILVVNHELSDQQNQFMQQFCHTVLLRGNQGFDFGGFKDAVNWMFQSHIDPSRLLFMNDSNFFAQRGLANFVDQLKGPEDVIAAFENWGEGYHLQSFALSVSGEVFRAKAFAEYWRKYLPSNNRLLAIEHGEKKLSKALLKTAGSSRVIYPVSALHDRILATHDDPYTNSISICQPWRAGLLKELSRLRGEEASYEWPYNWQLPGSSAASKKIAMSLPPHSGVTSSTGGKELTKPEYVAQRVAKLCELLNVTSPIHSGAYYFPKYLNSPLYKKDLVYRGRFAFWEIEAWAAELLTREEHSEFMSILRSKADYSTLVGFDKTRFRHGMK